MWLPEKYHDRYGKKYTLKQRYAMELPYIRFECKHGLERKKMGTFFCIEFLDRIAEHRTRHIMCMVFEKSFEYSSINSFSYFTEHPAARFLYEIVRNEGGWYFFHTHKDLSHKREYACCGSSTDFIEARDDDHADRPEMLTLEAYTYEVTSFRVWEATHKVWTDNPITRTIDQIPIIDTIDMIDIECRKLLSECYYLGRDSSLHLFFLFIIWRKWYSRFCPRNKYEYSCEPIFMIFTREEYFHIRKWHMKCISLHERSDRWHSKSEKSIFLTIFSFSCFEKTSEYFRFFCVSLGMEVTLYREHKGVTRDIERVYHG